MLLLSYFEYHNKVNIKEEKNNFTPGNEFYYTYS